MTAAVMEKPKTKKNDKPEDQSTEITGTENENENENVAPVQTVEIFQAAVENITYKRSEVLHQIEETIAYHDSEATKLRALLTKLGNPVKQQEPPAETLARGRGRPRSANQYTIPDAVEALLDKYPEGLTGKEIAPKLISEMGYKSSSSADKFVASVNTGGIVKLRDQKRIISVGDRPNTRYKLVKHATPAEISAFEAKGKK